VKLVARVVVIVLLLAVGGRVVAICPALHHLGQPLFVIVRGA
jgi:hypothetical protein